MLPADYPPVSFRPGNVRVLQGLLSFDLGDIRAGKLMHSRPRYYQFFIPMIRPERIIDVVGIGEVGVNPTLRIADSNLHMICIVSVAYTLGCIQQRFLVDVEAVKHAKDLIGLPASEKDIAFSRTIRAQLVKS